MSTPRVPMLLLVPRRVLLGALLPSQDCSRVRASWVTGPTVADSCSKESTVGMSGASARALTSTFHTLRTSGARLIAGMGASDGRGCSCGCCCCSCCMAAARADAADASRGMKPGAQAAIHTLTHRAVTAHCGGWWIHTIHRQGLADACCGSDQRIISRNVADTRAVAMHAGCSNAA